MGISCCNCTFLSIKCGFLFKELHSGAIFHLKFYISCHLSFNCELSLSASRSNEIFFWCHAVPFFYQILIIFSLAFALLQRSNIFYVLLLENSCLFYVISYTFFYYFRRTNLEVGFGYTDSHTFAGMKNNDSLDPQKTEKINRRRAFR